MIHSAVTTFNRFQLIDGHLLHLVKLVGAVTFYHNYTDNITIDVEDGTRTMCTVHSSKAQLNGMQYGSIIVSQL